MEYDTNYVVAVDFDGTIAVGSTFEKTGKISKRAVRSIQKIKELGCITVLWTTREDKDLEEALNMIAENNLSFDYINDYPVRGTRRKVCADIYIDDKSTYNGKINWKRYINRIKRERNLK